MNIVPSTRPEDEVAQIEKHKYFLSEKAGHDVGWEYAEQDWRENFGPPSSGAEKPGPTTPQRKGLGGFFKRLISRAAV